MTDFEFETKYDLTDVEIRKAMKIAHASLYSGRWRLLSYTYIGARAILIFIAFILLGVLSARHFGDVPGDAGYLVYIFYFFYAVPFWLLELMLRKRAVLAYRDSHLMDGQIIQLSSSGIQLTNSRSKSFLDWRDVRDIRETTEILVVTVGINGIALPNRLLLRGSEPATMRAQIKKWHHAARVTT